MEDQNDQRLQDLAGKIASIRHVTNDIYVQAQDSGVIDTATHTFGAMASSVKGGAARLSRAAQAGHPVFKTAGVMLVGLFVIVTLVRFFF